MEFVLGGAGQGKTAYITEKYGFAEAEITEASEDAATDLSARCITHIERYVRYCMKNGIEPEFSFTKDAVIAGDDIFCGIVPMEPEIRAWREACGRYMTRLANMAEHVTRVSCGIPQTLK